MVTCSYLEIYNEVWGAPLCTTDAALTPGLCPSRWCTTC